jgi:hypothetical protein
VTDADDEVQRVVLDRVLELEPIQITVEELVLDLGAGADVMTRDGSNGLSATSYAPASSIRSEPS